MRTLYLTLEKKWFDMIASGEKKEEYREMKTYWDVRLAKYKSGDIVEFRNGYAKDAPRIQVELKDITCGEGRVLWGAPKGKGVYIIRLGKILTATREGE